MRVELPGTAGGPAYQRADWRGFFWPWTASSGIATMARYVSPKGDLAGEDSRLEACAQADCFQDYSNKLMRHA
jgi:hypothetical protein